MMGLDLTAEYLNGIKVFEPKVYSDNRGWFLESYRSDEFEKFGIITNFVQDNHSKSSKHVLRGMHFQWDKPQGKLIRVVRGSALFVEIDIRYNSGTVGQHIKIKLSDENKRVLWVPPGFANGFLSLEENTDVLYKCTALWNGRAEDSIRWNDPELGIEWGIDKPIVSAKDNEAHSLADWLNRPESKYFKI